MEQQMSNQAVFITYLPPKAGLPFLSIVMIPGQEVVAIPCDTLDEAEALNANHAAGLVAR